MQHPEIFYCGAGSLVAACRLSCSVAYGILVPQPGTESVSPVLQGGFLTTELPGKSLSLLLKNLFIFDCAESSLLRMGFLQLRRAGATLLCHVQASYHGGFSCCGARALGHASFSSLGTQFQ